MVDKLKDDPIGALLINKRHLNVHRASVRPDHVVEVEIKEKIVLSESVRIEKYDKEGRLVQALESPRKEMSPKPTESKVNISWFFSEYNKEPVVSVCERYLRLMKGFVEESEQKFP